MTIYCIARYMWLDCMAGMWIICLALRKKIKLYFGWLLQGRYTTWVAILYNKKERKRVRALELFRSALFLVVPIRNYSKDFIDICIIFSVCKVYYLYWDNACVFKFFGRASCSLWIKGLLALVRLNFMTSYSHDLCIIWYKLNGNFND